MLTNYNKCVSKLPLVYLLLNIIIYAQLHKKKLPLVCNMFIIKVVK